ncbi:choice-of-anchor D domain-containing protein [Rhizobacter sp. OV335]|uniref:choice-of-anchor D domain-containing protein n=1 Tax=Rhizobacter sp. OV335 TaxID=1500264 RepID=UPI0013562A0B|nr:choice-of-anchor D domain-containing protein [Rhizobacter sp. OV335]
MAISVLTLGLLPRLATAQPSVAQSGAATFTYAVQVPPGIRGMAPNLSLDYSSLSRANGIAGVGWSLRGVMAVGRCGATRATDGAYAGVIFNSTDKLCLDGERLIQLAADGATPIIGTIKDDALGSAAGAFKEFRTEKDAYARIRSYGFADGANAVSGPAFFRIWTKDGKVIDIGSDAARPDSASADATIRAYYPDSRIRYARMWVVSRIADVFGNKIDFKYRQRDVSAGSNGASSMGHEWSLAEVQYAGNKVLFDYTDRAQTGLPVQDISESYHRIEKSISAWRLGKIRIYANAGNTDSAGVLPGALLVREVRMVYEASPRTQRSRLRTIQACHGPNALCTPPTTFDYSAGGSDFYSPKTNFSLATTPLYTPPAIGASFGTRGVLAADFNGDGRTDILSWSNSPNANTLWLSDGNGHFTQSANFNILNRRLFDWRAICYGVVLRDFNGDGLPDIFAFANPGVHASNGTYCDNTDANLLYVNRGDGSFEPRPITGVTLERIEANDVEWNFGTIWAQGKDFFFIDLDGDGKLDVVTTLRPERPVGHEKDPLPVNACDDVTVCTRVYRGDGRGGFTEVPTPLLHRTLFTSLTPLGNYTLDYDGDGYPDINTNAFSDGAGNIRWSVLPPDVRNIIVTRLFPVDYQPIDYDGDGQVDFLSDLGMLVHDNFDPMTFSHVTIASGFLPQVPTGKAGAVKFGNRVVADFNGDGKQDVLTYTSGKANTLSLSNGDGSFTPSGSFNLNGLAFFNVDLNLVPLTSLILGDFNGDGYPQILLLGASSNTLYERADASPPDLLTRVVAETGLITSFNYFSPGSPGAPGDVLGRRYTGDTGTPYAATGATMDVVLTSYLVATMNADNGVGGSTKTEYGYTGMKISTDGRDSLGFRVVKKQSVSPVGTPITSETRFLQSFPYVGQAGMNSTYRAPLNAVSDATLLTRVQNIYCDQMAATGADASAMASGVPCPSSAVIKRPYLLDATSTALDLEGLALPSTVNHTTVNASGDPLQSTAVTSLNGNPDDTFQKVTSNFYWPDDTRCTDALNCKWILGRLQQTSTRSSAPGVLLATSAGNATNATATRGSGPTQVGVLTGIDFGSLMVGQTSTKVATLANDGAAALSLTPPTASSVTGADFRFISTTCTSSLPVGGSCTVSVSFLPTAGAARTGQLSIAAGGGTLNAALAGSGTMPSVSILPGWTNWGIVGAGSDSGDVSTIRNDSPVAVLLTGHAPASNPTGTMRSASSTDAGACNFGTTVLAPGGTCRTFFGTDAGAVAGTYTAVDQVSFVIQGLSAPTFSVQQPYAFMMASPAAPATVDFSRVDSAGAITLFLTLINGADAPFENIALAISGADAARFSVASNGCGVSTPAHSSCMIGVTFTPGSVRNGFAATLSVAGAYSRFTSGGKASLYPHPISVPISLTGVGYGSVATLLSAPSYTFPATWFGGAAQTFTVTYRNDGTAPMTLASPSLLAPLAVTGNGCTAVAPGAACNMVVALSTQTPGIGGSQSMVPGGATTAPAATTLGWTVYYAEPRWSTTLLDFGPVIAGTSASQTISLFNLGNVAYDWATNSGIANLPQGFSFNTSACGSVAPSGGSCPVTVTFSPPQVAPYGGPNITMVARSIASNVLAVQGVGVTAPSIQTDQAGPYTAVAVSPATAATTVTYFNSGQMPTVLNLSVPNASRIFSMSTTTLNCPSNGSCGSVTLSSGTVGITTGTLVATPAAGGTGTSVGFLLSVTAPAPLLSVNPASLAFGVVAKEGTRNLTLTLSNTGNVAATGLQYAIATSGGSFDSGSYGAGTGITCPAAGGSLAAGASCTYAVRFLAGCTGGSRSGTLTISTAGTTPLVVSLTGSTNGTGICR